jgi:MFS family permease
MLISVTPLRRYRDYRFLYFGQMISLFGSMMTYVAVPYQVYQLSHSSFLVGALGCVQLVPLVVFGLWGGAYADALDRRRLLIGSELFLSLGSLALVVNAFSFHPSLTLIFVVSGWMSAANGFHRPSLDGMTPQLVPRHDLAKISALDSLRSGLATVAGPALAGIAIAQLGLPATYAMDVVSFMASLFCLSLMRSPPVHPSAPKPGIEAIKEGIRYARSKPELMGTYIVDIIAMTFAMPMALFPAMADVWGGARAAGWLYSSMSIGGLIATLTSGWCLKVHRHGAAVILAATGWGFAIFILGFLPTLPLAVGALILAGGADMMSAIFRSTIWNETIPTSFRGRLAGLEMISYMTGPLVGNMRAGYMAAAIGLKASISVGGFLCVAGVLACIPFLPAFWKYRRQQTVAIQPESMSMGSASALSLD